MKSLVALTDPFAVSHSGSTRTPGSAPSPMRQNIQKRFHSLYVGTCAYSHCLPVGTGSW